LGPGVALLDPTAMFFVYLLVLAYLFLGISIIADIFMK
jgi:hypothetical protein